MKPSNEINDGQQTAYLAGTDAGNTLQFMMAGIKARNETALAAMFSQVTPLLRTIISRMAIHDESEADNLMKELYVEVWQKAHTYDETKGKALGWLVTLARRRAIDYVRRRQAHTRAEERLRVVMAAMRQTGHPDRTPTPESQPPPKLSRLAEMQTFSTTYLRLLGRSGAKVLEPALEELNEEYLCASAEAHDAQQPKLERTFRRRLMMLKIRTLAITMLERARPLFRIQRRG